MNQHAELLKTASVFGVRLSVQGDKFVVRHEGERVVLTHEDAECLVSSVIEDVRAEGARYDEHGPDCFDIGKYLEECQEVYAQRAQEPLLPDITGRVDDIFDAAARYNQDPENCSAQDEDAAWQLMINRQGGY